MARKTQAQKKFDSSMTADDLVVSLSDELGFSPMGDTKYAEIENYLPTFFPLLDANVSGVPFKRLSEIYAEKGVGKSTFVGWLTHVANVLGIDIFWIDTEGTASKTRMKQLGVDIQKTRTLVPKPNSPMTIEYVGQVVEKIIDAYSESDLLKNRPLIIIWDSLGSTGADEQMKKELGEEGRRGRKASAITDFTTKITPKVNNVNVALLVINQVRQNQNKSIYNPKEFVRPGATALDHWESMLLFLTKHQKLRDKDKEYLGHRVNVFAEKLKNGGKPESNTDLYVLANLEIPSGKKDAVGNDIMYDFPGFSYAYNIIQEAIEVDVIKKSASWMSAPDENGEEFKTQHIEDLLVRAIEDDKFLPFLFKQVVYKAFPEYCPYLHYKDIDVTKWPGLDDGEVAAHYAEIDKKLGNSSEVVEEN